MDESMTKTDAREALSAYIDGELPADQVASLEAVLAEDEELAGELRALRDVVGELASLPEIEAPEGFLGAVMARVEAGETGDVEGEDGVIDFDAERRRIAAIKEAAAADSEQDRPANVVSLGWWLKGPAIVAAAALLVIGLGRLVIPPDPGPPAMMAAAPRASSGPALAEAPAPTGLAAGDGLAEAGEPPLGLGEPSPEVAVGFAGSPAARPASPPAARKSAERRSGIRVADDRTDRPAGVYAAEYEIAEEGGTEAGEAVASADFAPQPDGDADPKLAEPDDPDGVSLAEPDDPDGAIGEEEASAPMDDMAFGLAPKRSAAKAADESDADAGPTAGTLSVQAADGMRGVDAAVRARGWTIRYLGPQPRAVDFDGATTSQTVEIAARGTEDDLRSVLRAQGNLRLGAVTAGADGLLRVRLTVVHASAE